MLPSRLSFNYLLASIEKILQMCKLASRQDLAIAAAAGSASEGILATELLLEYVNKQPTKQATNKLIN